ncbi:FAD-dependent thymidylate synthase [Scytonema sp. NUACC26]|uniref:FAD-dependent thymidylate synthase n=1 Tax=Scytonema sp. NUACC26 TaxID=3140176 RepID=UPI0034DC56F3
MKNSVQLLGYYGGDKRVCLSAWQSTTEELGIELPNNIPDRVDVIFNHIANQKKKSPYELLDFLAQNNHGTPFEKAILDFQLTAEIASHVHSLKHRISAINAESARYKEFQSDRYYIPDDWDIYASYENSELVNDFYHKLYSVWTGEMNPTWGDFLDFYSKLGFELYHSACDQLSLKLGRKRAKESARYFLGYNTQLNYDWQMNFRSFVNVQQLRNDEHAQKEIHELANTMLYLVENIEGNPFKYCLKAFNLKSDENWVLL